MEIRPLTPTEQKYTYAQSMQIEGQTGTIGHLRGDFATTGYGFYTTWFDTRPQWKSDEFKTDLDTVINALREDKGLLHNRYDMGAFARKYPESAMQGNYCTEYGFRVDTGKHAFLFRCNPTFQIATLLGTPRYKAGTPFHTAVKTVPRPVRLTAHIAKLC